MSVRLATVRAVALRLIGLLCFPFSVVRRALSNCLIALLHKAAVNCINNADYSHAEIAYKVILRVRPNDRLAIFQLVCLYDILNREDEPIQILENWLQSVPDDIEAHITLSGLYVWKAEAAKAREHLEASARIAPNSPEVLLAFGAFHRWNGNLNESSAFLRSALKERETPLGLSFLAQNLIDQGKKAAAASSLERGIQLAPDASSLYYTLARCGHYHDPFHPHIVYMKMRIDKDDLPATDRSVLHFALGEAFDSMGQWDEAFAHFKAGNDLNRLRATVSIERMTTYIDQQIETFTQAFFASGPWNGSDTLGESLIFVVGMPRSGTTLVEQILASHPEVRAGGERRDISAGIEYLQSASNEPYPACVRCLDRQAIDNLARMYLSRVSWPTDGTTRRFVDKGIDNWREIGLITTLFPKAKLVYCQRNPLDSCISCYFTDFTFVRHADDLTTLGLYYRQYDRLMSHWRSVCTGRILDLQYENLVSDPESQIRKLLAYCELPWYDGCLSPHQTTRVVLTASASQVKLPIHSRSVGRWKNYQKHIGPLIDALGVTSSPSIGTDRVAGQQIGLKTMVRNPSHV